MKLLVLMYHRIAKLNMVERYTVSPHQFEQQMRYLSEHNYPVINLASVIQWISARVEIPERAVVITFDDGFLDTYEQALPVLGELGFTATFFVISGLVGKTNVWMAKSRADTNPLMSWPHVQSLMRSGFEVGSHSLTHPDFTTLNYDAVKVELTRSKQMLEDRLGGRVDYLAYPYGRYDARIRQLEEEVGYRTACTTAPGFIPRNADLYQLPRLEIEGTDSLQLFARKVKFGLNKFTRLDLVRYYARRVAAKARLN